MPELKELIFVLDNGKRYVLKGEELDLFLAITDIAISLLYSHNPDDDFWKDWNNLMKKIYGDREKLEGGQ